MHWPGGAPVEVPPDLRPAERPWTIERYRAYTRIRPTFEIPIDPDMEARPLRDIRNYRFNP